MKKTPRHSHKLWRSSILSSPDLGPPSVSATSHKLGFCEDERFIIQLKQPWNNSCFKVPGVPSKYHSWILRFCLLGVLGKHIPKNICSPPYINGGAEKMVDLYVESNPYLKKNHPSSNSHEVMKPSYHQALFVGPFPTDDFFEVPTKHTPSSGFFSPTSSSKMSLAGSWHVVLFKWFLSNEPRKNPPTFHSTGWFIGIIIMICYNPYIPG